MKKRESIIWSLILLSRKFFTSHILKNRVSRSKKVCVTHYRTSPLRPSSDEQFCDKTIFSSSCELKISIYGYFSWFWKAKAIFWPRKYCFINIALFFIVILLVKIARLTRALECHILFEWPFMSLAVIDFSSFVCFSIEAFLGLHFQCHW